MSTFLGTERRKDSLRDYLVLAIPSASSLALDGRFLRKAACPRILVGPKEPMATSVGTDMWPWKRKHISPQGRVPWLSGSLW